jgi:predicted CoA-binding protein
MRRGVPGFQEDRVSDEWKSNLVDDVAGIAAILKGTKRIAVLGMKTEEQAGQPALYVPEYMIDTGHEVFPVLVYYPGVTEVLGRKVYRKVAEVPGPIDMVNVFRRPNDIPPHVEDILAARPTSVWFQQGITHDEAAETFARAGIQVVQDRCLMVEHRRLR